MYRTLSRRKNLGQDEHLAGRIRIYVVTTDNAHQCQFSHIYTNFSGLNTATPQITVQSAPWSTLTSVCSAVST
jgi:hypothetical protein